MSIYLVTARGGVGKSAVAEMLSGKGVAAFDADDIDGLCRWEDARTGQPVEVDYSGFVDYAKVSWNWQAPILHRFFAAHMDDDPLILCGSASNQSDFYPYFEKIFVLTI